ncbi:MAG: ABC transporter permease [Dehalococcoidia bacterium]
MRGLRKYGGVSLLTMQTSLAYPAEAFARSAFMAMIIFVFIQLWSATFKLSGHAAYGGFDLRRIVWYLVVTETVVMSSPRTFDKIDLEVKQGDLAYNLTRPYVYGLFHAAAYWGSVVLVLPVNFVVGGALAWATVGAPPVSAGIWPALLLTVLLAIALNFAVELAIGLTAFWFEDTNAFFWIYQKLTFTLGGLFLPLTLFPSWLRAIAERLPFSSIAYAPARLVAGADVGLVLGTVATQGLWLVALAGAASLIYRGGVRRLNVNGG